MVDRRCFVQFIHPGGEHTGHHKSRNQQAHKRKFLKSKGRYVHNCNEREGEIVFWGEWEAESDVIGRLSPTEPGQPRFLYEPYLTLRADRHSL